MAMMSEGSGVYSQGGSWVSITHGPLTTPPTHEKLLSLHSDGLSVHHVACLCSDSFPI